MTKITTSLPATFHQRLLFAASQENKPVSEWLREVIVQTLKIRNRARLRPMYEALEELDGIGEQGITDASTTIDEVLYGESGAWRENAA